MPGPGTQEEIDEIQGHAGRLQHQYVERMDPYTIRQHGVHQAYAGCACQGNQQEEYDRRTAGNSRLLLYAGEQQCEQGQQQIESHEGTQIPVLGLLVGSAPEQGSVEGPEVHGNIAAGNHEVGNHRCYEDRSGDPGNADTHQLAFPE